MNLEQPKRSESQTKLEKLQGLDPKEKLVLFELAYRLGVTVKKETTTNFLTKLHSGHLSGLYEKWQDVSRLVNDQGRDMASLPDEEFDALLNEALTEETAN